MKSNFTITLLAISALTVTMLLSFSKKNKIIIDGSWSIVEVQTVKSDGTLTTIFPRESKAIFSHNNYSFCWTSHNSTIRSWQIVDSVKLNRFNQSIINTGTFKLKDSILTTKATFAINPMFVNGQAKFKCSFNGDTLVLRGVSVFSSDHIPHPVYKNGSFIVSKLLKN